jgi:hypothetical protein
MVSCVVVKTVSGQNIKTEGNIFNWAGVFDETANEMIDLGKVSSFLQG